MAELRRYIHVGNPKCASTSLQISFFGNHPELYHLGNGYNQQNNTYIDEDVTTVAEVDLRYKRDLAYNREKAIAAFKEHFEAANGEGRYKAVGLSSEFLCFTLSNEIDVTTKARRLHEIFGDNTCIIFVFREQFSLLKSLYLEMIKGGYAGRYRNFLEYTYLFQDRSWCLEFCFDRMVKLYSSIFGPENVCAIPFELLKEDEASFIRRICTAIGVSEPNEKMRELNQQAPTLGLYECMRRFNERCPHEFGSAFYEPFSVMRMATYFHNELQVAVPYNGLMSDFLRIPMSQAARQFDQRTPAPDIDLSIPKAIEERLTAIYAPSNAALAEMTGYDLAKYGYRLP